MEPGYREKQAKTQPVILEPEHDGLRVLARIIARSLIQQQAKSKQGFDQKAIQRQAHISREPSD